MKSINPFPFLVKALKAGWNYFSSMNSEGGKISIKRNISLMLATILCFVIVFSLVHMVGPKLIDVHYIPYIEFVLVFLGAMLLLILSVTSIEKITDLIQRLKFGVFGGQSPQGKMPEENKEVVVIAPAAPVPQTEEPNP